MNDMNSFTRKKSAILNKSQNFITTPENTGMDDCNAFRIWMGLNGSRSLSKDSCSFQGEFQN